MCTTGGAVSSLAILLDDCDQDLYGFDVNPGSLNRWLKANNGFTNGNQVVWTRTDSLSNGVGPQKPETLLQDLRGLPGRHLLPPLLVQGLKQLLSLS